MTAIAKPHNTRQSNLELFRIIIMLFIIAHHYVVNSGLLGANGPILNNPISFHSLFFILLGAWGKIGINCFVLISGFFMCKKDITLIKFLKLLCVILFYRILISLIFWLTGYEKVSLYGLVRLLLPIMHLGDGFTSAYLVFFLFIPFINLLIHHMTEKQHIRILALLSFAYIFLGTFRPVLSVTMNYVSWFVVLYLIASYIRLYPKKLFEKTKTWGLISFGCIIVSALSVIICTWMGMKLNKSIYYNFVSDSNTFLAVATGVSLFLFFKNLKVRHSKIINSIAATTFGVLLIHANSDAMRRWLWSDTLKNVNYFASPFSYLHIIVSVIGVFAVCSIIDFIRIKIIEKPFFDAMDKILPNIIMLFQRMEKRIYDKLNIRYN